MLRSIVKQLCLLVNYLPENIEKTLQNRYDKEERMDQASLLSIVQALVKNVDSMYLVIDALDECVEISLLSKLLIKVSNLKLNNVHILSTSRDLPEIRRSMGKIANICIPIGSSEKRYTGIDEDIEVFVRQNLVEQYYLSLRTDKIKTQIIETLTFQANGMYVIFASLFYSKVLI